MELNLTAQKQRDGETWGYLQGLVLTQAKSRGVGQDEKKHLCAIVSTQPAERKKGEGGVPEKEGQKTRECGTKKREKRENEQLLKKS